MVLAGREVHDRVVIGVGRKYELILIARPEEDVLARRARERHRLGRILSDLEDQMDRIGCAVAVGDGERHHIGRRRRRPLIVGEARLQRRVDVRQMTGGGCRAHGRARCGARSRRREREIFSGGRIGIRDGQAGDRRRSLAVLRNTDQAGDRRRSFAVLRNTDIVKVDHRCIVDVDRRGGGRAGCTGGVLRRPGHRAGGVGTSGARIATRIPELDQMQRAVEVIEGGGARRGRQIDSMGAVVVMVVDRTAIVRIEEIAIQPAADRERVAVLEAR